MKTLNLKTGERIAAVNLLNDFKGDLVSLRNVFNAIDKLVLTEKEMKELSVKQLGQNITWSDKKDKITTIELTDDEFKILKDLFEKKSQETGFSVLDRFVISLWDEMERAEKLEESKEEKKVIL